MKLENGQSILFTGDSITDCGRARPVGTGAGLGEGYVAFVNSLLATCYPEREVTVLNTGIGGNTVIDLDGRWESDVLAHTPDWLSVMIGINDVWRHFGDTAASGQITMDLYVKTYRKLLEQIRGDLEGLVLMTPYVIEPNLSDPMRERMDKYSAVVEQFAREFDAVFVNVQAAFDHYLEHRPWQSVCEDRVHPDKSGHMIIAAAFLTAIGLDWKLADPAA